MNRIREAITQAALSPARINDDTCEQSFCFATDFPGFAGHFPDYPILPAVLQTLMAQMLAEQAAGRPLQFSALERAKFTHQIGPGDRIDVHLSWREEDGTLRCSAELKVADKRAASFILRLDKGANP
jgi:3-hydroxyacyl-[acyl-carrier-protein] dehydratase